jgi:hypothetical protein
MLKCPKNNKFCTPSLCLKFNGKNFICSGINLKPSQCKTDYIKLCLCGELCDRSTEMTLQEASFISAALSMSAGELSPSIVKKFKKNAKKNQRTL